MRAPSGCCRSQLLSSRLPGAPLAASGMTPSLFVMPLHLHLHGPLLHLRLTWPLEATPYLQWPAFLQPSALPAAAEPTVWVVPARRCCGPCRMLCCRRYRDILSLSCSTACPAPCKDAQCDAMDLNCLVDPVELPAGGCFAGQYQALQAGQMSL